MKTINCDVLVCGAGVAGFCAAVQSARCGADTVLVERYGMAGGIMTVLGNPDIGIFHTGARFVVKGIGWELAQMLEKDGYAVIPEFSVEMDNAQLGVWTNIPCTAAYMDKILLESGVKILYNVPAVDCEVQDGKLNAVTVSTKQGLMRICAKVFIDCTGDGDIAAWSGCEYELSDELQPGTIRYFLDGTPREFDAKELNDSFNTAVEQGKMLIEDIWCRRGSQPFYSNGNNITHVNMDGCMSPEVNTRIQIEGRQSVLRIAEWSKENGMPLPAAISPETAARETRRIVCDTRITGEDYVKSVDYDDNICYSFYPIDLHRFSEEKSGNIDTRHVVSREDPPRVPMSAMTAKGLDNLLVAGRCVCSDREANSALRVKASCMAMGQAAGACAYASLKHGGEVRKADINEIKDILRENGAVVPE